ncbi:MAG: hypothetical protein P8J87_16495 [Verrucomicrobiales bacterium]|nr:hypothetical protein [Verrucomicrobiales bacterium]
MRFTISFEPNFIDPYHQLSTSKSSPDFPDTSTLFLSHEHDISFATVREFNTQIIAAANGQFDFQHPVHAEGNLLSFCQFAGSLTKTDGGLAGSNAVCSRPAPCARYAMS